MTAARSINTGSASLKAAWSGALADWPWFFAVGVFRRWLQPTAYHRRHAPPAAAAAAAVDCRRKLSREGRRGVVPRAAD